MPDQAEFPRLLYIGDVPIEASYHGSALLYRLLENYPAERLRIIEAGLMASKPTRRLRGVAYEFLPLPLARLQTTRLAPAFAAMSTLFAASRARGSAAKDEVFRSHAILTVTHGYSWLTAARVAQLLDVPLHLICHDEWVGTHPTPLAMGAWNERAFAGHYRSAASRICVSPFMAEHYSKAYGVPSTVVYPSRAAGAAEFDAPPERLAEPGRGLTCAFAGSVNSADMVVDLALVADCLEGIGGRLLVYGPFEAGQPGSDRLQRGNVEFCGLLPSADLIRDMRERADVLFVPIPFAERYRSNMEIHFPSKLTDYTAVGLPILIYGPSYCSAVKWAQANEGAAAVVTEEGKGGLSPAIARLASDAAWQMALGRRALELGRRYFSHDVAFATFMAALRQQAPARA